MSLIFTSDQTEIIRAALYFSVFKYPLTQDELYENSAISISKEGFLKELDMLIKGSFLRKEGEFILINELTTADISKRLKGNEGAKHIMPTAYKYSKIIGSFPFVEGVFLSGALSKNYYDEKGDIDFFIVTKPDRLWLCRTFLILRYKLLPRSRKKFWCVNYFISSNNLIIPDINVFTGTELAFLYPAVNYPLYKKLVEQNNWYKERFPNKNIAPGDTCIPTPAPFNKRLVERLLSGRFGNWLDTLLLELTLKHWRKKYPEKSESDFNLQFRSRKDVCKRHTHGFQNKILVIWETKSREFELKHKVSISPKHS